MHEAVTEAAEPGVSATAHPEEIKASVDLGIGKNVSFKATVRTTPAGLVAAGVMVAAVVLSITTLVRAARQRSEANAHSAIDQRDAGQPSSAPGRAGATEEER